MNSKSKIRLFIALEVLIWILIIVSFVSFIKFQHAKKIGEYKTYRLFMQDVDGLIEGSSVRMMGVPIGYIKTISIVQDEVYVKFLITDKNIEIPQGAIATVEFNGMAGSKSLEIYSPDSVSKASGKIITLKKTNRLGAALGLFDDMFAKLDSILVRCSHFSGRLEEIFPKSKNEIQQESNEPINFEESVGLLNDIIEKANETRLKFKDYLKPKPLFNFDFNNDEEQQDIEEVENMKQQ